MFCCVPHYTAVYQGEFVPTEARQLAVRSYLTAGVALVGASVIAVSPLAPPMPEIHLPDVHLPSIHGAEVELAALTSQFPAYGQVFDAAVANLEGILKTAAANPTPILTKILSNQSTAIQALLASLPTSADQLANAVTKAAAADPTTKLSQLLDSEPGALQVLVTALQTAFGQVSTALTTTVPPLLQGALTDLSSANVAGAINNVLLAALTPVFPLTTVLGPALGVIAEPLQTMVDAINALGPVGTVIANPLQNVVNVLNLPTTQSANVMLAVSGLIGPLIEAPAATGAAIQGVIDAISKGDAAGVLGAVVDAPAVIAGGVLNGGLGPDIGDLVSPALGLPPGLLHAVFGGVLSPPLSVGPDGSIETSGTLAGLQTLAGLIAGVLKPPAIPAAQVKTLDVADDGALDTPSALPSPKSTLVTVKTPRELGVKPTTTPDTQAASTATTTAAASDTHATAPDTQAASTATATPAASDAHTTGTGSDTHTTASSSGSAASSSGTAASSSGDQSNQPTKAGGKHSASAGDQGGRHVRSHGSAAGAKGGSGGGRHHAA